MTPVAWCRHSILVALKALLEDWIGDPDEDCPFTGVTLNPSVLAVSHHETWVWIRMGADLEGTVTGIPPVDLTREFRVYLVVFGRYMEEDQDLAVTLERLQAALMEHLLGHVMTFTELSPGPVQLHEIRVFDDPAQDLQRIHARGVLALRFGSH